MSFRQINILIIIALVEIESIAGTAPNNPIVRLCVMPSPTMCFDLGFLFAGSRMSTQIRLRVPYRRPRVRHGVPALLAIEEYSGTIEDQGGVEDRKKASDEKI
jgi:hypothetical protein